MSRLFLTLRATVKDGERALLLRNGRHERVLGPGRHRLFDPKRELTIETFQVVRAEFPAERYAVIKAERPEIAAELFEAVETRADELAIVSLDGRPTHLVGPWKVRVFWKVATAVEVERIDLRPQAVEITAQEMLTKDRIALRVTLTALRRIADPERAVSAVVDVDGWLYRLVQFAIREAVAARTLDEVLSAKSVLDQELRMFVRERLSETGIEVTELGVKDVILPGEIRELVNKVVDAERTAKANLIRRQEETAATRSLLNTAKLMEENPLLLRLKELESLERLVEKVGRIDLHAGEGPGLDALLNKLMRLKAPEPA